MATRAQIKANRNNAKKSTGPRTEEGKAVVAKNALKHGLLARDTVLPGEDPANFDRQLSPNSGEINCGARILACRVAIRGDIDSRSGVRFRRAVWGLISTPGAVPTTNDQTNPISPNSAEINCGARILACRVAIRGDIDSRSGARSQRAACVETISTPGAVPTTNDQTNPISPNSAWKQRLPGQRKPCPDSQGWMPRRSVPFRRLA